MNPIPVVLPAASPSLIPTAALVQPLPIVEFLQALHTEWLDPSIIILSAQATWAPSPSTPLLALQLVGVVRNQRCRLQVRRYWFLHNQSDFRRRNGWFCGAKSSGFAGTRASRRSGGVGESLLSKNARTFAGRYPPVSHCCVCQVWDWAGQRLRRTAIDMADPKTGPRERLSKCDLRARDRDPARRRGTERRAS